MKKMRIKLNTAQAEAASHFEGPMLVLAGPGSGKTTVILRRVDRLIRYHQIRPKSILVITFTKAAAVEMKKRYEYLGGVQGVHFATFHSFFFQILRKQFGYTVKNVLSRDEKWEVLKKLLWDYTSIREWEDDLLMDLANEIALVKNSMLDYESYRPTSINPEVFKELFEKYQETIEEMGKIDFDDMQLKAYRLLEENPEVLDYWRNKFSFILIDEFQDVNLLQYETIYKIALRPGRYTNLFVVGDDDQSIYKFRGSAPEFLINFPQEFNGAGMVVLDTNYRSTQPIIDYCNELIADNQVRYPKKMKSSDVSNKEIKKLKTKVERLSAKDITFEAALICNMIKKMQQEGADLNDIAVIYRVNMQSRVYTDFMMDMSIPFQIKDKSPSLYEHWISQDMSCYLSAALDGGVHQNLERVINRPIRYINKGVIATAKKETEFNEGGLLFNLCGLDMLNQRQRARLDDLRYFLANIKNRKPYEAIQYIRQVVGYEDYIKEYSAKKNVRLRHLLEIMEELQESAKLHADISSYIAHMQKMREEPVQSNNRVGVTLTTMHSAKGLEFETVFVISAVEGLIPYERSKTLAAIEEERRLMYVALSRAKKNLYISTIESRYGQEVAISRFLK